jgi:hypothetical protein
MKKTIIIALLLAGQMGAMAQSINIHKTDGTSVQINASEIEYIDFSEGVEVEDGLCPDSNHPHMIDLGIGTLWSCCNVGASSPESYGSYYAWGETSEKTNYSSVNYAYYNEYIGDFISGTDYDAATANWGGAWRMPTYQQTETLLNSCPSEWTQVNSVNGLKFTGPNGNSIFLPAAGYRWNDYLYIVGRQGFYWVGMLSTTNTYDAFSLFFGEHGDDANWTSGGRERGHTVRPVAKNAE